ncbi:MAG: anaerobic sulfatase maturase [Armatimonadota bacterium]
MIGSVLIKPAGPDCNIRCTYCFYRQKAGMFDGKKHRMSIGILETLISQALRAGVNAFSWQGGEPTLMGLDFYKRAIELEIQHARWGMSLSNAFQTNGILLDDKWASFFAEYKFLIGLSIDGPSKLHDYYRKDVSGKGTHSRIVRSAKLLRDHGVEFNVLTLVNNVNVREPDAVYDFLRANDIYFMQFVPCVEPGGRGKPSPFSITAEEYGSFLVRVFDRWMEDFPNVSIRDFDDLLSRRIGRPAGTCTVSDHCGDYVVIEHNGDVFACDFFVTPKWKLGNITETPLRELVKSDRLELFAKQKSDLGPACQSCPYLSKCNGGCQKHRVVLGGEITQPSYFCKAYKRLFAHTEPHLPGLIEKLKKMGMA